jgi:hypothetical protein
VGASAVAESTCHDTIRCHESPVAVGGTVVGRRLSDAVCLHYASAEVRWNPLSDKPSGETGRQIGIYELMIEPVKFTSNEESLKLGNNDLLDELPQLDEARADLYSLCGSLIERYKNESLAFHFHFIAKDGFGSNRDFCAIIARSECALDRMAALRTDELRLGMKASENGQQDTSMFVDASECLQSPNGSSFGSLPVVVRLQCLDFCNRFWGNPIEPMASELVVKSIESVTYREHVFFTGLILRSKYKFPYQVIEGRSQILDHVSDNEGNFRRDRNLLFESQANAARVRLFLSHHFARVEAEIPQAFMFKSLEVFMCPDDFLFDGIERSH